MKVLFYYDKKSIENFEVNKLIHLYREALKLVGIDVTFDEDDDYDIVHMIESANLAAIKKFQEKTKVVYQLLSSSDTELIAGDVVKIPLVIKSCLDKADVISVNWSSQKTLLRHQDIVTPIENIPLAVDTVYLDHINEIERDAFLKQYHIEKGKKVNVSYGTYTEIDDIKMLISIARMFLDEEFFFFGEKKEAPLLINSKKIPANLHFENHLNFDLYRSALFNASRLILINKNLCSSSMILDAMYKRIPIYSVNNLLLFDCIIKGKNCVFFHNEEEIFQKINNGDDTKYLEPAYEFAKNLSLLELGNKLKYVYKNYQNKN